MNWWKKRFMNQGPANNTAAASPKPQQDCQQEDETAATGKHIHPSNPPYQRKQNEACQFYTTRHDNDIDLYETTCSLKGWKDIHDPQGGRCSRPHDTMCLGCTDYKPCTGNHAFRAHETAALPTVGELIVALTRHGVKAEMLRDGRNKRIVLCGYRSDLVVCGVRVWEEAARITGNVEFIFYDSDPAATYYGVSTVLGEFGWQLVCVRRFR